MKKTFQIIAILLTFVLCMSMFSACEDEREKNENGEDNCTDIPNRWDSVAEKPVIYLCPENDTVCSVKVNIDGELTCTYPTHGVDG